MINGRSRRIMADEAARVRLAAGTGTDADVLTDLIDDPSVTVRAALALNSAAPALANGGLVRDQDERVRILLARKLAALVPTLSAPDQARLSRETWDTLKALVADETARVRAVIADAVKELPDAPRELIRRLAQDTDTSVCEPVIRLSPLLATEDLVALVTMAPAAGTVLAVARRGDLEAPVSDAIAATADAAAIRALLANRSAHIREATLDALVARSVSPRLARASGAAPIAATTCGADAERDRGDTSAGRTRGARRSSFRSGRGTAASRRVAGGPGCAGDCGSDRHVGRGGAGAGTRRSSAR